MRNIVRRQIIARGSVADNRRRGEFMRLDPAKVWTLCQNQTCRKEILGIDFCHGLCDNRGRKGQNPFCICGYNFITAFQALVV